MASNTSNFPASFDYANHNQILLEVTQTSQNYNTNQTTFSYALYIRGVTAGPSSSTTGGTYSITGAVSASDSGLSWSWSASSPQLIKSGTFTKTHDSSGNLSAQTVSATVTIYGWSAYYGTLRPATTNVSVTITASAITDSDTPVDNTVFVGNSSGVAVRGIVYVGNSSGVAVEAKEVYVGNASGVAVKAKY